MRADSQLIVFILLLKILRVPNLALRGDFRAGWPMKFMLTLSEGFG